MAIQIEIKRGPSSHIDETMLLAEHLTKPEGTNSLRIDARPPLAC